MGEQFFMGIKNDLHHLLKRIIIAIIGWMIICTLLVNVLFSYFKYYVNKEEAKVFYDVRYAISETHDGSHERRIY